MSENTTAVQTVSRDNSVISRIGEFNQIADVFSKSGLFPDIKSQGQAFVKIMAGAEIGLPPFTSMNAFYIFSGRVTMYANTIAARIKTSGRYNYRIIEKTATRCTVEFYEAGKLALTETWTAERAAKAGTQNMAKYPDAMLFARCITSGARAVCPEVIGAFYSPEELGATVNADGEIIDAPVATKDAGPNWTPAAPDVGDGDNQATVPPPADTRTAALKRIADHSAEVKALAKQARDAGDIARADDLDAVVKQSRITYADKTLSIGELHKYATSLKDIATAANAPIEAPIAF